MRLCFVGFGAWGGALGIFLARHGISDIHAWDYLDSIRTNITQKGDHPHLGEQGAGIPSTIKIVNTLEELPLKESLALIAVASEFFLPTIRKIPWTKTSSPWATLILTKGLEPASGGILSDALRQNSPIPKKSIFVLSGPTIAKELLMAAPTIAVLAGLDEQKAKKIQKILNQANFHVSFSPDIVGTQVGGSMKNIYAIGYGILEGLEAPANTRALYLIRCLEEISRMNKRLGGKSETVYGASGLADLLTTSLSANSRNSRLGRLLAQSQDLALIQKEIGMVTEGVEACRIYLKKAQTLKIKLPLAQKIQNILNDASRSRGFLLSLQ